LQGDVAKRRRELLGNTTSTASTPKSLEALDDDDIFGIETDSRPAGPAAAVGSSPQTTGERSRSDVVSGRMRRLILCIALTLSSDRLKAILEDNGNEKQTHSKSSRSKSAVVSHSMLLAQQKLSMLKALEESSLQASILPSIPPAIVDCDNDDDEPPVALQSAASAADSGSNEPIHLKFMTKTKQQVAPLCAPSLPPTPIPHSTAGGTCCGTQKTSGFLLPCNRSKIWCCSRQSFLRRQANQQVLN
jgi:hypothetical protein